MKVYNLKCLLCCMQLCVDVRCSSIVHLVESVQEWQLMAECAGALRNRADGYGGRKHSVAKLLTDRTDLAAFGYRQH